MNRLVYTLKQFLREPIALLLSAIPLFLAVGYHLGSPALFRLVPPLMPYQGLFQITLILMQPFMLGWAWGFLYLEDKDQGMVQIYQISPLGAAQVLSGKILLSMILSAVMLIPSMLLILPAPRSMAMLIQLWLLLLPVGPLSFLSLSLVAQNRVQGLTVGKVLAFVLVLPYLRFFLVGPVSWLAFLHPVGWTWDIIKNNGSGYSGWLYTAIGLLQSLSYLLIIWRRGSRNWK